MIPPRCLVLSSGGIRGLSYVGALLELKKRNLLNHVKEILGVSIGALFALGICLGYSMEEMYMLGSNMDFTLLTNIDPDLAFEYFEKFGVDDGSQLKKFVSSILKAKQFDINITFNELYKKTHYYYRCFATDLNNCKLKEFSYKTTPDESVIFGTVSSMNIPLYYIPQIKDNIMYVDGAIFNSYPINLVSEENKNFVLGFTFSENHIIKEKINSIGSFFEQMYACSYLPNKVYNKNTIIIPCGEYPMWKFNAPLEDKIYLIESGRKAVIQFLDTVPQILLQRRNSF